MGNNNFKNRHRSSSNSAKNYPSLSCTAGRSLSASNLFGSMIQPNQAASSHRLVQASNYSATSPCGLNQLHQQQQQPLVAPISSSSTLQTTTNSATDAKKRTNKIIIPYERWIKNDCKKWGHFKDYDFYNLILSSSLSSAAAAAATTTSSTATPSAYTHNNNNSNIIITINNLSIDSPNAITPQSNTSFIISENLNNNSTILSSFLSSTSSNESKYPNINNCNIGPLHYVNGNFFKPIERLGDSQFILSQWPLSDVVVTVPCNIERYRPNDKATKQTAIKLNRVIGVCEEFLVFQIWKGNNEVEIFIYEYNTTPPKTATSNSTDNTSSIAHLQTTSTNKIVRKLNRRFNSRTYTCLISPDKSFLLITPDYEFNYSYSHHTQSHAESTIILNINTFALLHVIPARCDQRFAFDPRYGLPSYSAPRFAEFDNVRGQIYDLSTEKVVVCSNHTLKTKVFRVEYTKDGYLIIVICTLPVFQRRGRRNYFIYILNSSTLLHMRSIIDYRGPQLNTYSFSNDFNLLFNMYPSLSNCASSIAVLKNIEPSLQLRVIELYSLPNVRSMSLKELCRRVILRHVDSKHLNRLPLPPKMISYLSFNSNNNNSAAYINNNASAISSGGQIGNSINLNNLKKNLSNKCNNLSTRINNNKKSFSNFIFQIKRF